MRSVIWIILSVAVIALTVWASALMSDPTLVDPGEQKEQLDDYEAVATTVDAAALRKRLDELSSVGSRVSGYPGAAEAARQIAAAFEAIGLEDVHEEAFRVAVPMDRGATLQVEGSAAPIQLHCLWPNLVRTPTTPTEGIRGQVVNAGKARPMDFNGKPIEGSIVLLDFNCQTDWLNAFLLGAKAVIFVEPKEAQRPEAEAKFLTVPANTPRYWMGGEDAQTLLAQLEAAAEPPAATVKARMEWENAEAANVVATLPAAEGTELDDAIVLSAYYDSMSVVPALSPGAEQACSVVALLELARVLKQFPVKRKVVFVATAGHGETLAGMRAFIRRNVLPPEAGGEPLLKVAAFVGLDLASHSRRVGLFFKGHYIDQSDSRLQPWFSHLGKRWAEWAGKACKALGRTPASAFVDCINSGQSRNWQTALPSKCAFDAELALLAGHVGLTFATTDDSRLTIDSPLDTADRVDVDKLAAQVKLLCCALPNFLNTAGAFIRKAPANYWTRLDARAVEFNFRKDYLPNEPLPGALIFVQETTPKKSLTGVRGEPVLLADDKGTASFDGLPERRAVGWWRATITVGAFVLDDKTGSIIYAPDLGSEGAKNFPIKTEMNAPVKSNTIVCFKGRGLAIYDLADQRYYIPFDSIQVLDAGTNSSPANFGYLLPRNPPWMSATETCSVLFAKPGTRLRILMGAGLIGKRLLLLNATEDEPLGTGYAVPEEGGAIALTPLRAAKDMWRLDEDRIARFRKHGLENPRVAKLHRSAARRLRSAEAALYPSLLTADELRGPAAFATRLREPKNPLSKYLRQRFSEEARALVDALKAAAEPSPTQVDALVDAVNGVIQGESIHQPDRFAGVSVPPQTLALLEAGLSERATMRVNRSLLAAAYPDAIATETREEDYGTFLSHTRAAWALEARIYPEVLGTADDVVKGLIFYLILVLPFAFFAERLFISAKTIQGRILGTAGSFVGVFALLAIFHPAFRVSISPLMILLAFVILSLSILVISLVVRRFEELMAERRAAASGIHAADVSRTSAAVTAFLLGIGNLRKRPVRTTLTATTIVLLSFSVLSLTAVVQYLKRTVVPYPGVVARYEGLLLRGRQWQPTSVIAYDVLLNEFGGKQAVVPRAWYYSAMVGQQSFVALTGGPKQHTIYATALMGMTEAETEVTRSHEALVEGRWLQDGSLEMLLPTKMVEALESTPKDILGTTVTCFGKPLRVVGVFDEAKLQGITDLDGEPVTPVDYVLMATRRKEEGPADPDELEEYIHLTAGAAAIVPYEFLIDVGGTLRSIVVRAADAEQVSAVLHELMPRTELTLFAGREGKTDLFSTRGSSTITGAGTLIVPTLLAALIVFNTMLGSIYERTREIGILSSIGLAPKHIGALFLAESVVYAVVGTVVGYLLGQMVSLAIHHYGLLPGLQLNYSSTATVLLSVFIMAVVVGSSIWPAVQARRIAVPGLEARWQLPEPVDDAIDIELPFTVARDTALGVNAYLEEYCLAHGEAALGGFAAEDVRLTAAGTVERPDLTLAMTSWLAPFDVGVSQHVELATRLLPDGLFYGITLRLARRSGDQSSWRRLNRHFTDLIRRQFLIWRILSPEARQSYADRVLRVMAAPDARDGTRDA